MRDSFLRAASSKGSLPVWVRRVLRAALIYCERLARWPIVLLQVRGATHASRLVLLKSALRAPIECASQLSAWQDPVLLDDAEVVVHGIGRFQLRARSDDLWHVLPWRERAMFDLLRRHLRPGDVFVDGGANIGIYTVLASRLVGETGKVIAVEMMPDTAARLERHVEANAIHDVVTIVRAALSDTAGQTLTASVELGRYGQASISGEARSTCLAVQRVEVPTITLDDLCGDVDAVRMIKLDLEGAELAALKGGVNTLSKTDGLVYESIGKLRNENDPVEEFLRREGLVSTVLDGTNRWAVRKEELS